MIFFVMHPTRFSEKPTPARRVTSRKKGRKSAPADPGSPLERRGGRTRQVKPLRIPPLHPATPRPHSP